MLSKVNFHPTREPLAGLCPLSLMQCDSVRRCCIIAGVQRVQMFLGALSQDKMRISRKWDAEISPEPREASDLGAARHNYLLEVALC